MPREMRRALMGEAEAMVRHAMRIAPMDDEDDEEMVRHQHILESDAG